MNSDHSINCKSVREQLDELIYDLLEEPERLGVEEHLDHCAECRRAYDHAVGQKELLKKRNVPHPPEGLAERTIAFVMATTTSKEEQAMTVAPVQQQTLWLGSRKFWKIAAMVLFVICAGVGVHTFRIMTRHALPVEVSFYSQSQLTPGLLSAARVYVRDAHESKPIEGAQVRVSLTSDSGRTIRFADLRTDEHGFVLAENSLPDDLPEGDYRM